MSARELRSDADAATTASEPADVQDATRAIAEAPAHDWLFTVYASGYNPVMDESNHEFEEIPYAGRGMPTTVNEIVAKFVARGFTSIKVFESRRRATHTTDIASMSGLRS